MFCGKCGAANDDNTFKCVACGGELHGGVQAPAQPVYAAQPTEPVPNYLVQAILTTICCCLPFGIAAIVYAAQVNSKLQSGDYAGAVESSHKAKMWCWWAFGIGLALNLIVVGFQVVVGVLGVLSHRQ